MVCSHPPPAPDSVSYIYMVQHLIERCLLLYMTLEECMTALAKHANVKPLVTTTVWNELKKSNQEFFTAYEKRLATRQSSYLGHAQLDTGLDLLENTMPSLQLALTLTSSSR